MTDETKTLKTQWYDHMQAEEDGALEPNIPLLRKAVEWVEEQAKLPWNQREWDQAVYIQQTDTESWKDRWEAWVRAEGLSLMKECGTVMCVAGYISLKHTPKEWEVVCDEHSGTFWDQLFDPRDDYRDPLYGDTERFTLEMGSIGAMMLGITRQQASDLFNGGNDATAVRHVAEQIAGERL